MRKFILFLTFCISSIVNAQEADINLHAQEPGVAKSLFPLKSTRNFSRKGDFYFHWGYNFSAYAKSDISFVGTGYDFTLQNVVAHDRPTKLGPKYYKLSTITIPQFNFHLGYFIKDNYSISVGWDHMKYVMDIPQTVKVNGFIAPQISNPDIPTGTYAGTYENRSLSVKSDMLLFEHTDGYNYASTELERYDDIWVAKSRKTSLTLETGFGAGLVFPRTDVHLFGVGKNNYWNLAGYGFSAKAGIKFYIKKWIYLQNSTKTGWTALSKIHTTGRNDVDKASQSISYIENYTVLGFQF